MIFVPGNRPDQLRETGSHDHDRGNVALRKVTDRSRGLSYFGARA